MRDRPLETWVTLVPVRLAYPVLPRERDMCSSYRDVGASGGLAGLVLPLSKCLVHQGLEFDRKSRDGGLSPRIVSL